MKDNLYNDEWRSEVMLCTLRMTINMKKIIVILSVLLLAVTACIGSKSLTEKELKAFGDLLNDVIDSESLTSMAEEIMNDSVRKKFPAVKKVFVTKDDKYLFISEPIAYNGAITLAVAIDSHAGRVEGIRIVKHSETEHYVRDFENTWFTNRFNDKNLDTYLKLVHLEESSDDEIVIVTGATTTTEGVVNGVNACIGAYNEIILKNEMPAVALKAKIIK